MGTYIEGMDSGQTEGGHAGERMLAAFVSTKSGPCQFELLGEDAVVRSHRDAFETLLASMKPSDG